MNTILAAWSEGRVVVRILTSFYTALANPEIEDSLDRVGDDDWNV